MPGCGARLLALVAVYCFEGQAQFDTRVVSRCDVRHVSMMRSRTFSSPRLYAGSCRSISGSSNALVVTG
jgi:hypothetical protein